MKTIAILGYPGAGKTWAVWELLRNLNDLYPPVNQIGLVRYHLFNGIAVVGIYDGSKFQGTDKLSMAVSVDFNNFFDTMREIGVRYIIAEGDRINNRVFFENAIKYGTVEKIKCMPDTYEKLLKQREGREHVFKPSFLKTVTSKVDKHYFDKTLNSEQLLEYLIETVA